MNASSRFLATNNVLVVMWEIKSLLAEVRLMLYGSTESEG